MTKPLIVGLGGTTRADSQSELALRLAMAAAQSAGAETLTFTGKQLELPIYGSDAGSSPDASRLVSAMRRCSGVIISTPSYHGGMSGMIKNALDYTEDLRNDSRPYFDGRAVGIIVCAAGWQNIGTTLVGVRSMVHALRGWPTPMGVGVNTQTKVFDSRGECLLEPVTEQIELLSRQVVDFARSQQPAFEASKAESVAV